MASASPATDCLCLAASDDLSCRFAARVFRRRALGPHDVLLAMRFCGICHTDAHVAAGHLVGVRTRHAPCVPGHELAGECVAIGTAVTRVRVGDGVGVGCLVDSCGECAACRAGEEQHCKKSVGTYNAVASERAANAPGEVAHTLGGYTTRFVVHERFAVIVPRGFPLEFVGPIMCAGTTLFDPLRRFGAAAGSRVGVVGLGGLGVMGLKLAAALGCEVTAVTSSAAKADLARRCGAAHVVVSGSAADMAAARGSLDLVLNTVSVEHDYDAYTQLLKPGAGRHVILGVNSAMGALSILGGPTTRLCSSMIGGVECSQAVLDLCAKHGIRPEITVIPVDGIAGAYEDLSRGNVGGTRYVLDLATLDASAAERLDKLPAPALAPYSSGMNYLTIVQTLVGMFLWRSHV